MSATAPPRRGPPDETTKDGSAPPKSIVNTVGSEASVDGSIAPAAESPRPVARPERSGFTANLIPIAVASALLMEFIDSTALSTALPTLARAFHSDPVHLKLALTTYLLALAVFAPASGWMADRFGGRRVFLSAMTVFLIGSALCGLSRSLPELVAARLVQGLGGAMMTPVGRLIVVASAPRHRLVSAMTWFTMPAMIGPLVGPPLSGVVLAVASWPFIFYINIPVGLAGMMAVILLLPHARQPDPGPFDLRGFALLACAIVALVFVAETVGVDLVPVWVQLASLGLGAFALVAFVRHALSIEHPVLNLRLFQVRTFAVSTLGGTLVRLGVGASPLLLPLLLQVALGWSPLQAGLITVSQAVGVVTLKSIAQPLIRRWGFRTTLILSALTSAGLSAVPGLFRHETPVMAILVALGLAGFARSLQFTSTNALAYADVPRAWVSQASTLSTVIQQLSMSLGVSYGALMLHLARGQGALTADRFFAPFLMVGGVTLLALPVYLRLRPNAGAEMAGQTRQASA